MIVIGAGVIVVARSAHGQIPAGAIAHTMVIGAGVYIVARISEAANAVVALAAYSAIVAIITTVGIVGVGALAIFAYVIGARIVIVAIARIAGLGVRIAHKAVGTWIDAHTSIQKISSGALATRQTRIPRKTAAGKSIHLIRAGALPIAALRRAVIDVVLTIVTIKPSGAIATVGAFAIGTNAAV